MTTRTRSRRAPDRGSPMEGIVTAALEDLKAVHVKVSKARAKANGCWWICTTSSCT
jgi:hypothetical protein